MRAFSALAPRLLIGLLLSGIAALFFAQLISITAHRLDYPIVDDWGYYLPSGRMPNELALEWLFAPAADTLHVTGKLLDWLYFHVVSHDYRGLALTSFVLAFGGWLVCAVLLCLIVSIGHIRAVLGSDKHHRGHSVGSGPIQRRLSTSPDEANSQATLNCTRGVYP